MHSKMLLRSLVAAGVVTLAGMGAFELNSAFAVPSAPAAAVTAPVAPVAGSSNVVALPNFASLVQRYGPAVVNVTVMQKATAVARGSGDDDGSDDPFAQFFRGLPHPDLHGRGNPIMRGQGSGFIVSPEGYILTNAHVVDGASEVTVRLTDRREYRAKVVGSDKQSDIAVIKIDAQNLPVVKIGNAGALQVGEWVLAIGSPYGFDNTVTSGIVSAKARSLPDEAYVPFIQTDVPVNPGNSGGPLFNMNGEVIGINSQIYSETGGYQGLSFAIPIDIAVHVKDELIAHGKVTRGRIGVSIQDVNQQLANSFGLPRPMGALVSEVEPDSPGARAKLASGDIITRVDGVEINRSADLPAIIADIKPGSNAQLEVWRGGKSSNVTVAIGQMKDASGVAKADGLPDQGRLGLAVRPLAPSERQQLGGLAGLVVEGSTGPAASAGIERGDVILSVNGKSVQTVEELRAAAQKAQRSVAVLIQRNGTKLFVPIELG